MSRTLVCLLAAYLSVLAVDRFALSRSTAAEYRPSGGALPRLIDGLAVIPAVALIFSIFFAISWRPLYALAGTFSFFVIFAGISRAKFEFIREPLIFSDIALVLDVFKHKDIFYASWLNVVFWVVALGYVVGASTLFMLFEPNVLPAVPAIHELALVGAGIAVPAASLLLLLSRPYRRGWSRVANRLFHTDDIRTITVRLGTFTGVMFHFLLWLGREQKVPADLVEARPVEVISGFSDSASDPEQKPLVVVWQSESFMDMRHFGLSSLDLPSLDRLRGRSVEWGRLKSVFEGGYTLRTEFSVLSGLSPDEIGADAHHPYLRAAAYGDVAWPSLFRRAGWTTHFIHPYDRRFFSRHRALPQLGFDNLTMLDGFDHDRERDGHYVSDMTLAKRVLSASSSCESHAQFIFAASMENHGPWLPGRCGGRTSPLDIYLGILERSDAALGYLADQLDRMERSVWLVFYGDHAPILKSFADPFSDPRTDYVVVPLGQAVAGKAAASEAAEKAPWNLLGDLVSNFGGQDAVSLAALRQSIA